jgi:hypothetical protein
MKETIITLLQQRMDKCTTEQFWAVASLTAADGFVIQSDKVSSGIALVAITIDTIYGVFFIFDRHFAFYRNRKLMGSLFKDERDAPDFLKTEPNPFRFYSLSGVLFYLLWVVLGYVAVIATRCG